VYSSSFDEDSKIGGTKQGKIDRSNWVYSGMCAWKKVYLLSYDDEKKEVQSLIFFRKDPRVLIGKRRRKPHP
jgi:hypothetical protein